MSRHNPPLLRGAGLHKGTEHSDGFADDQVLHPVRAFVRIKCFRIREASPHVVVGGNAVAAQQFPLPCDRRLGSDLISAVARPSAWYQWGLNTVDATFASRVVVVENTRG
jgi:hypothetical protein